MKQNGYVTSQAMYQQISQTYTTSITQNAFNSNKCPRIGFARLICHPIEDGEENFHGDDVIITIYRLVPDYVGRQVNLSSLKKKIRPQVSLIDPDTPLELGTDERELGDRTSLCGKRYSKRQWQQAEADPL